VGLRILYLICFIKLDTKLWSGFEDYSIAWFEEYCVVFGLRNGLRNGFMKLDTKCMRIFCCLV